MAPCFLWAVVKHHEVSAPQPRSRRRRWPWAVMCVQDETHTHTRVSSFRLDAVCPPLFHSAYFLQHVLLFPSLLLSVRSHSARNSMNGSLMDRSCSGVKHAVCRRCSPKTRLLGRDAFFLWICSHSGFPLGLCCCCCSLWPVFTMCDPQCAHVIQKRHHDLAFEGTNTKIYTYIMAFIFVLLNRSLTGTLI